MPKAGFTTITIKDHVLEFVKRDYNAKQTELARVGITTLNQYIVMKLLSD